MAPRLNDNHSDNPITHTGNAELPKGESVPLSYKKIELLLVAGGLTTSLIGLVFLGWQLVILNKQTASLNKSVENQEYSISSSKEMDGLEVRRFLLSTFKPRTDSKPLAAKYERENEAIKLPWEITNLGNNHLVTHTKDFMYDIVRCFNQEYWVDSQWTSARQITQTQEKNKKSGTTVDLVKSGIPTQKILPGIVDPIEFSLSFPRSAFSNFQTGEKIAIESAAIVYDPDQTMFRKEIEELDFHYGPRNSLRGRAVVFPAIIHSPVRRDMFQLTPEGWISIPTETSCTRYLDL